jgi:hypothetical protein
MPIQVSRPCEPFGAYFSHKRYPSGFEAAILSSSTSHSPTSGQDLSLEASWPISGQGWLPPLSFGGPATAARSICHWTVRCWLNDCCTYKTDLR